MSKSLPWLLFCCPEKIPKFLFSLFLLCHYQRKVYDFFLKQIWKSKLLTVSCFLFNVAAYIYIRYIFWDIYYTITINMYCILKQNSKCSCKWLTLMFNLKSCYRETRVELMQPRQDVIAIVQLWFPGRTLVRSLTIFYWCTQDMQGYQAVTWLL